MSGFEVGDKVRLVADEYQNFEDWGLEIGMTGTVQEHEDAGEYTVLIDGQEDSLDFLYDELEAVTDGR